MKSNYVPPDWALRINSEIVTNQIGSFGDLEVKCRNLIADFQDCTDYTEIKRLAISCLLGRSMADSVLIATTARLFYEAVHIGFETPYDLGVAYSAIARKYAANGRCDLARVVLENGVRELRNLNDSRCESELAHLVTLVEHLCPNM